ncbi:MAG: PHP domain-containing protein [Acidobacteriota bacterium]
MVDLHLHTTASDGLDSPAELTSRARLAGITTIGLADHDTVDAIPEMERLASEAGLAFVPGLEVTAVWEGSDVHLLAYFVDARSARLGEFLEDQRTDRLRRARLMAAKLTALGVPVDVDRLIARCRGRVVSRPLLAQAMVEAGHVPDVAAAFDLYLGDGRAAYVPRVGASPGEVVSLVNADGGFVSMAHPGVTSRDGMIAVLAEAGLGALEAYHPDHTRSDRARYLSLARDLNLAVSGGSDYHGAGSHHADGLGVVGLTSAEFAAFCARAGRAVPAVS